MLEIISLETLKNLAIFAGIPVIRSIGGWAVKALEDNKVTKFEWKLLISTVIRIGVIGVAGFYGLNGVGINIDALSTAFAAIIADKFLGALKK